MQTVQKTKADPDELRAIVDLLKQGWTREDICRHFGFCRRTYYYRLAQIREIEE